MLQRRKTVKVCSFCGNHYQDKDSNLHGEGCEKNPSLKSCVTCDRSDSGKCTLGLIPIDFVKKLRIGRYCSSWRLKDENY